MVEVGSAVAAREGGDGEKWSAKVHGLIAVEFDLRAQDYDAIRSAMAGGCAGGGS